MPKFKVLVNNRFGEGWKAGDIVDMDENAARVPLLNKELERVTEGIEIKTEDPKTVAGRDLKKAKKILDDLGIKFWLTLGTCLGAYRDGDFCEGDWDDVDLGVDIKDFERKDEIVKAFLSNGYTLKKIFQAEDGICPEISLVKQYANFHTKVDLWFYTPNPENQDEVLFRFYKGDNDYRTCALPAKFHKRFRKIKFHDEEYLIPFAIKEYLSYNYGDWQTPIPRQYWNWYSDNKSKTL